MKNLVLAFAVSCCSFGLRAQINLNLKPGTLKPAVEKVLNSYENNFKTIQGDTLEVTASSITFNSTVKPDAALQCTLTRFNGDKDFDYNWEAVLLKTEDFATAVKKYNQCCQQLKNLSFRGGGENIKLDGDYDEPEGSKNFYSTIFVPDTSNDRLGRIRVEVSLEGDYSQWVLKVMVYDRVHDDKDGNMQ